MAEFSNWISIILIYLFFPILLGAQSDQDIYFQHRSFGIEDKLGRTYFSDEARCIQDKSGFYWLSGDLGMYRFDGNEFNFIHKNEFNLIGSGDFRHSIDAAGNSWIYKKRPIQVDSIMPVMLDLLTKEVIQPIFSIAGNTYQEKIKHFSGISQGGGHLFSWDISNNVYEIIGNSLFFKGSIPKEHLIKRVNWISEHKKIIVSTEEGVCYKISNDEKKVLKINLPLFVHNAVAGAAGIMLKTSEYNGDRNKQTIYFFDVKSDSLYNLGFNAINPNLKIIGGNNINEWVIRINEKTHFLQYYKEGGFKTIVARPTRELFLNEQESTNASFLNDQYWFFFGGLVEIIQIKQKQFVTHLIEEKEVSVRSIHNMGDSLVVFNTYRGHRMLDIFSLEKASSFHITGLEQGGYGFAAGKNGHLYSGLHTRAILHIDLLNQRSERIGFQEEDKVYESGALLPFVDSTGKVWVGLESGLGFLDTLDNRLHYSDKGAFSKIAKAAFHGISPAFEPGYFWFATSKGAFLFDPYAERLVESISKFRNREVVMVRQFNRDSIWVIPQSGPAYVWSKKNDSWDSLNIFKAEWQNNLHDILPDKRGFLWFPTNNGLIRYDPFKRNFIRLNIEIDGLPFNEFNRLASLILPDGRFLLGGVGGAISIDPQRFSLALHNQHEMGHHIRLAKITTFSNGRENNLDLPTNINDIIKIGPNVEQLVIDFAYLYPMHPPCTYFYRPQEGSWFKLDRPQIILDEFGYGLKSYEFKAVELGTERILGETKVRFKKDRPWYLWSITFIVYFSFFLLLIYLFIRWKTERITEKNKHLEQLVFHRTEELNKDRELIKSQRDSLKQLTNNQQHFFSILGHELRNSLITTINLRQTIAYLLNNNRFNDLDKVALQLRRQALGTREILEQLLQWGRMVVYDTPPEISIFNLSLMVDKILGSLDNMFADKKITVSSDIPTDVSISFDQEAMKIILRNLIHNAIKFSPEGSMIEIQYTSRSSKYIVSVTDKGAGIVEEELRSWEAGDGLPLKIGSKGEKGTGLGLMICDKLAVKNGGKIDLSARKGGGVVAKIYW